MGLRAVQPALFGIVVLTFALPFSQVSCSTQPEGFAGSAPGAEAPAAELRGYELLVGGTAEDVDAPITELEPEGDEIRFGAEPFALLALVAAFAGVGFSLFARPERRALSGVVAGAAGVVSVGILGLAPVIRSFGGIRVAWKLGYWVCLAAFVVATAASWLEHRRVSRPPYGPPS